MSLRKEISLAKLSKDPRCKLDARKSRDRQRGVAAFAQKLQFPDFNTQAVIGALIAGGQLKERAV